MFRLNFPAPRAALLAIACLALVAASPVSAHAEPTEIVVRVISKGAKFIGTSMGGAHVSLENALTGELLVSGYTAGSTGDTARIMNREEVLSSEDSAKFTATLDLDEPTLVRLAVRGPMTQMQAQASATQTMWVMPGKDVSGGDGWLVELPGMMVDIIAPQNHVKLPADTSEVRVEANVTLGCGCGIKPDGTWDAAGYEIGLVLYRDGKKATEIPLDYAGNTSLFGATLALEDPGVYEALVYAYDPDSGNTGLDRSTFIIQKPE